MLKKEMVTIAGYAVLGHASSSPHRRPLAIRIYFLVSASAMNMPIGVVVGILAIQSKCFLGYLTLRVGASCVKRLG
jgi:hypothetical protein